MSVTAYIAYFRQVAMLHKLMVHDQVSEVFDAVPSSCHFRPFSASEDFSVALPYTIADGPSLHLNMFERDQAHDLLFDAPGVYPAGFIITKKATPMAADAAMAETATIASDVIARITVDYYAGLWSMGKPDLKRVLIQPVGPIWEDRYGWAVTFPYRIEVPGAAEDQVAASTSAFNEHAFERQFEGQFQ